MPAWTTCLLHPEPSGVATVAQNFRALPTPVYRGSTVLFPEGAAVREGARPERDGYTYGLHGTPTTAELARRICVLEGGLETVLVPSGQAAIALVNLTLLSVGDHVLLPRNAYAPGKHLARTLLGRFGVEVEIYDPASVEDVRARLRPATPPRPATRLVWCESPGSITMEVPDVPAIAKAAHAAGALVAIDNTWAAGVLFDAFAHGADITLQALTKYVGGHSDLLLGSVTAREEALVERLAATRATLGIGVSPDDCSLALRGLGTMAVRLKAVEASALAVAQWLADRPEVERVLHPALASCPGHDLWRRDFSGSSGLFSFVLRPGPSFAQVRAMVDALELFEQGYSWGGVESLALHYDLRAAEAGDLRAAESGDLRAAESGVADRRPRYDWRLIRLQIGLEDVGDLLADLDRALSPLKGTRS